ncbi:HDIG domain-containing protein [Pseudomonas delhiensis]|uniref:HDIG domain-containing protein n=1 Tax=Pseudomonas delhiensis TaxID=366289 RepID=A0A239NH48_9PSED|nr:HD-GYP domain-containing protein [Pseudomonas delhiensis]SDK91694.1 HDIG domain-containing protein [Pseudomonas delhiensis]SNT54277.1 HDIG domain-containing protein [Pseudomonas delhiensis]
MLKRIHTDQVRLGMFIQSLEGNWLSHPFWKTRFMLENPGDLRALQNSGVQWLWIDDARGLGVTGTADAQAPAQSPAAPAAGIAGLVIEPVIEPPPPSYPDEFHEAARILERSRKTLIGLFHEARMGRAIDLDLCLPLVEDICASLARDASALISLARLKNKDEYTYMHSVTVCALMVALARQLGLDVEAQREAGLAGMLHDIGKMAMPPAILNKPGKLDEAELAIMRTHPERGHEILRQHTRLSAQVLDVCLHHHERYDGTGYPHRLAGNQISLLARMAAICDVYDAITSDRPYKCAWEAAGSLARMASWEGHFDPQLFQAFVKAIGIYPIGSLVRLESGQLGVVVQQNPENLTRPQVKVFFCTHRRQAIAKELRDLADVRIYDRIVQREDPARWGFRNLERLWLPDGLVLPGTLPERDRNGGRH